MRHEFPWLGGGFVHAVSETYVEQFRADLEARGFHLWSLDGGRMLDVVGFWAEIKRCFEFPDYQGSNWDAFTDSFGDLALPARFAVVWLRSDRVAAENLKLFAEAVSVLTSAFQAVSTEGAQGEVIIAGSGAAFRRP